MYVKSELFPQFSIIHRLYKFCTRITNTELDVKDSLIVSTEKFQTFPLILRLTESQDN